ncbi:LRP6 [Branchiostoma lanceolatum]|uniref:LRP6 protein n=1 Tax=Branchiostoma lanceolatum TaxID=7740 RepID=A0A8J9Z653_BRALA|nr:LRP6 [Branchiostoma lanceolatum]
MYWGDDDNGRIDRAAMDGSNQTTIISGLTEVEAITIDYNENRLYYSAQSYHIYSLDLLGNDIRHLLHDDEEYVNDIAVDENYVYWSSTWDDSSSGSRGKIGK